MKRYTAPSVLAQEFCWDISDIQDYRYQYGRSDRPIYAIGNTFWCAVKKGQKPARHKEIDFEWKEYNSKFADSIGWQIWKCESK